MTAYVCLAFCHIMALFCMVYGQNLEFLYDVPFGMESPYWTML